MSITSPLHNGYNVSCKGGEDGAVNLTVSGGYHRTLTNGTMATSPKTRRGLKAGNYSVQVKDANSVQVTASITLSQPVGLEVALSAPDLPQRPPHDLLQLLQRQRDHHGHRRGDALHLFLEHRPKHPEPLQPHGRHLLGAGNGCQRLHQTRRQDRPDGAGSG